MSWAQIANDIKLVLRIPENLDINGIDTINVKVYRWEVKAEQPAVIIDITFGEVGLIEDHLTSLVTGLYLGLPEGKIEELGSNSHPGRAMAICPADDCLVLIEYLPSHGMGEKATRFVHALLLLLSACVNQYK